MDEESVLLSGVGRVVGGWGTLTIPVCVDTSAVFFSPRMIISSSSSIRIGEFDGGLRQAPHVQSRDAAGLVLRS